MAPMTSAFSGETKPAAGVTATSPTTSPVAAPTAAFAADSAVPGPDDGPTLEKGGADWLTPIDRSASMAASPAPGVVPAQ